MALPVIFIPILIFGVPTAFAIIDAVIPPGSSSSEKTTQAKPASTKPVSTEPSTVPEESTTAPAITEAEDTAAQAAAAKTAAINNIKSWKQQISSNNTLITKITDGNLKFYNELLGAFDGEIECLEDLIENIPLHSSIDKTQPWTTKIGAEKSILSGMKTTVNTLITEANTAITTLQTNNTTLQGNITTEAAKYGISQAEIDNL